MTPPFSEAFDATSTPEHRCHVAATLHDWCALQRDACAVVDEITSVDRRLGVWLACQVVRTVLHHIPAGEDRPRIAVEAAERWVRGKASSQECRTAARNAEEFWLTTQNNHTVISVATASSSVAYAAADEDNGYAAADAIEFTAVSTTYNGATQAKNRIAFEARIQSLCAIVGASIRSGLEAIATAS